ncbi:MAG: PorV/PorQ family protein [Bacteroidota bacterium]
MKRLRTIAMIGGLCVMTLVGQTKTGTTIGQFLLIEPSPRGAALGGTGVTSTTEAFAAYYNPGNLGQLDRSDIQFAHNSWFGGVTLNYANVALRLTESMTGLLTLTHLSSGEIDVRTVEQPLGTGERFTVSDLALGVGYAVRLKEEFSCGIMINYIEERIWHSKVSLIGINVGTLYELSPGGLRIGASLSNFGSRNQFSGTDLKVRYDIDPQRYGDNSSVPADLTTDEFGLPILFVVGVSYPFLISQSNIVRVAAEARHPNDNSESISLGVEYEFQGLFAVRAGYQDLFQKDSEVGLTLGAGFMLEELGYNVRFDYSWGSHQRLGDVQRIAVAFAFLTWFD